MEASSRQLVRRQKKHDSRVYCVDDVAQPAGDDVLIAVDLKIQEYCPVLYQNYIISPMSSWSTLSPHPINLCMKDFGTEAAKRPVV